MILKSVLTRIFVLSASILMVSALPKSSETPAELQASIQKKWPGSKTVLIQPDCNSIAPFYRITTHDDTIGWAYISRVFSCRTGGCQNTVTSQVADVSHEYFDYYAILDKTKNIIEIKVYNYAATHGAEVCSKGWLRQFKGYNGSKSLRYGKDIDAISGATISGTSMTADITDKMQKIRKNY